MHLEKRNYFGKGDYIEPMLGTGYDTDLFSGTLLFPDEPENYFLKYELLWRSVCARILECTTCKLFLSVIIRMRSCTSIILPMILFLEEPYYLFGEHDIMSDLEYVLEDDEFLEEGWDNDEQDYIHYDFWVQYDASVEEDLRLEGLYGERLLF